MSSWLSSLRPFFQGPRQSEFVCSPQTIFFSGENPGKREVERAGKVVTASIFVFRSFFLPTPLLLSSTLCTGLGSSNCTAASSSKALRKTSLPPLTLLAPRPHPKSDFFRRRKERRYLDERRGILKTTTSDERRGTAVERTAERTNGAERSNAIR